MCDDKLNQSVSSEQNSSLLLIQYTALTEIYHNYTLIGREKEWQIFTELFGQIFQSDTIPEDKILIIEGDKGCGKTRLFSEIKYFAHKRHSSLEI